jgi:hypothetical protein
MKKLLLFLLTITCLACSSDDDDNNCEDLSIEGIEIYQNFITAGLNYFTNPNNEACLEYEDTALAYIDYSNNVLDCLDAEDRDELEQEIEDLEAELADLTCS